MLPDVTRTGRGHRRRSPVDSATSKKRTDLGAGTTGGMLTRGSVGNRIAEQDGQECVRYGKAQIVFSIIRNVPAVARLLGSLLLCSRAAPCAAAIT